MLGDKEHAPILAKEQKTEGETSVKEPSFP